VKTLQAWILLGIVTAATPLAAQERHKSASPEDVGAETATHEELEPLAIEFERLASLCLHPDGNLLACDVEAKQIKVIDPQGELVRTIELPFGPEAIDVGPKGTIYCGGEGQLAWLDKADKVVAAAELPEGAETEASEESQRRARICNVSLNVRVAGIAVTRRHVFASFGSGWSTLSTSKLYRFSRKLEDPKLIAEGMRGCCQRCDLVTDGRKVYLAENSAHRVLVLTRNGKERDKWGSRSRDELEGFGACCNPMNLCFDAEGVLYTSESGLGRVKRYTPDGEFLGLVGYLGVDRFQSAGAHAAACSNIAIAVAPDGNRVYVMDFPHNQIRVLQKKEAADAVTSAESATPAEEAPAEDTAPIEETAPVEEKKD